MAESVHHHSTFYLSEAIFNVGLSNKHTCTIILPLQNLKTHGKQIPHDIRPSSFIDQLSRTISKVDHTIAVSYIHVHISNLHVHVHVCRSITTCTCSIKVALYSVLTFTFVYDWNLENIFASIFRISVEQGERVDRAGDRDAMGMTLS